MQVSRQRDQTSKKDLPLKGAAARTHALMVSTATEMMRNGLSPSVSEVAEEAGVARSTAYRYFPTRSDMVRAVVAEALGPILNWEDRLDGGDRVASLYATAFPRLYEHEATFRAALRQSLEVNGADATLGRGHRRQLLVSATRDLDLPEDQATRLIRALSLTFGVEAMVVLKDIWGLSDEEAQKTALWAAQAMIEAARRETTGGNV
ncbi:TetR/AcrR family transcriptional regulator [Roseibium salinum]|uniref:Helix-turn-helix domain containing protein n=1 Tax=Roseibium salinum TaxID=1604349 RepID=A0ABT3QVE0_9HYPH|nr:TetR/AcrR family transcriptional regulator [Roseibium sp. DSM 29163]MCX2720864.1 helix-turn-helix domain containing protein [Roseibium sp. DSM 29163]